MIDKSLMKAKNQLEKRDTDKSISVELYFDAFVTYIDIVATNNNTITNATLEITIAGYSLLINFLGVRKQRSSRSTES